MIQNIIQQDYVIVGFSTPRKFHIFPWVIRKMEKTPFSHVYIKIFSKSTDRYLVYQSSGMQVNFVGQDIFYSINKDLVEFAFPVSADQKVKLLQTAIDLAGKPYGMKQVLGMGLVRLAKMVGIKINNPWADGSKTYICSELIATLLLDLGYKFEDLDNVTPGDIFEKLEGHKWLD